MFVSRTRVTYPALVLRSSISSRIATVSIRAPHVSPASSGLHSHNELCGSLVRCRHRAGKQRRERMYPALERGRLQWGSS